MAITLNGTTGITTPGLIADSPTLTVDSANDRVGIGTATPSTKLELQSSYTVSATNHFATFARTGGAINAVIGYNAITLDYMYIGTGTLHPFGIRSNNTLALYIDANQNVGIGNANPQAKLHVTNTTLDSTILYLQGNNNYNYEFRTKSSSLGTGGQRLDFYIGSGGAEWSFTNSFNEERLRIKYNGTLESYSTDDTTPNIRWRSNDTNWFGSLNQSVEGGTITSFLSCGGDWSANGTTYSATKALAAYPTSAIAIHNQYNSTWGSEFVFLTKAGGSTTTDGAVEERLRITSGGQLRSQSTYNGSATTSNTFPCLNLNNLQGTYTSGNIIGGVTFGKSPGHSAGIRAGMIALYTSTNSLADNIGTELVFRTATESSGDSGERLRIDSSGNVGIGTNDPSAKLDVNGVLKCGPAVAPFISAAFRDYNDGSAIYASVVQAGGGKFISGESYYFNAGYWRSDTTTSTAIGLDSGNIRFLTRSGLTANTDFNGPYERLRITSSGIVNSNNYSFNGFGTNSAANVYLGAFSPGSNAYAIATLGVERLRIASDGRVIQDGVITWSASGYANLNSTFSYDISVRDDSGSGQGGLHKVYAGINHYNFSSYGTVLEQWISTRGTSTTEALTTHYVTSGQGGSWSVSKPSNNVLRITHTGGSLNAFGWYFIKVFSVE